MKQFKITMIITLITICVFIGCTYACAENNVYPRLSTVFEIENTDDYRIVKCMDVSRNVWIFYDENFEWKVGDIANLLLFDYNPKTLEDDEILEVYWEGYDPTLYYQFMG